MVSCTFFTVAEPANAKGLKENTIILEFSGADSDDISDLRLGRGKIFQKIARIIATLQQQGQASENVQPIIVVTKEKREQKGLLDY
ncbi:MAG: hypothetical protein F6K24_07390 [Okeania sp. SIO2D1]|nr:hypothetical protein [Okeania sp. SIO2D1]